MDIEEVWLFECANPGLIYDHTYYRFLPSVTRRHLRSLLPIRNMTIPEPLFGTFVENSLPQLAHFVDLHSSDVTKHFTTLPYVKNIEAVCDLSYLNGELEASLSFRYEDHIIPAGPKKLEFSHIYSFVTHEGIVARNLVSEQKITDELFCDFTFHAQHQTYIARTEKKIIEFMTDIVPRYQDRVTFHCPQNLLDQFLYQQTLFTLKLCDIPERMDVYQMKIEVKGPLKGITIDRLWDCLIARHSYIELGPQPKKTAKSREKGKATKNFGFGFRRNWENCATF